jgi:hypothetical protein
MGARAERGGVLEPCGWSDGVGESQLVTDMAYKEECGG